MMRHDGGYVGGGGGGGESVTLEVRNIPQMVSPGEFNRLFMGLQGCQNATLRLQGNVPIGTVVFANHHFANVARQQYAGWTGWGPKGLILESPPDIHRGPARPTGFSPGPDQGGYGNDDRHHGGKRSSPRGIDPPPGFSKQPRYAFDDSLPGGRPLPANVAHHERSPQFPPHHQQQPHQQHQGRMDPVRHPSNIPPCGAFGPSLDSGGRGMGRHDGPGGMGGMGMAEQHGMPHGQSRADSMGYEPGMRMEGPPGGMPRDVRVDSGGGGWGPEGGNNYASMPGSRGGPAPSGMIHQQQPDPGYGGGRGIPPGPPVHNDYGPPLGSDHVGQPGPGVMNVPPQQVAGVGVARMEPPVGNGDMVNVGPGPGMSGMIAQLSDAGFAASINAVASQGIPPDPYVPEMRPPSSNFQDQPPRQPYSFETPTPAGRSTLYVDGLPPDITKRELAHIFRPFEGFATCRVVRKDKTGPILGFVEYNTAAEANAALTTLQGYPMDIESESTSLLRISHAKSKPSRHQRETSPSDRPRPSSRQSAPNRPPANRGFSGDPRGGPQGRLPAAAVRGRGDWQGQRRPSPPRGFSGGQRRQIR